MKGTKTPQKTTKNEVFERKLHLGRLEFLLGAEASADPAPPALDDAVFEFITDKIKRLCFFLLCFSPINFEIKNKYTNPQNLDPIL
jgi:hypothetical protein